MSVLTKPIKFGTDGWRGLIADEFTFENLALVAPVAAKVLYNTYYSQVRSRTIIVGYDRRFMAENFARVVADALTATGFDVLFSETYAPTPAFSWAAKELNALGALVITASHNPGRYLGLKVKSAFGGSVPPEVTKDIEALLTAEVPTPDTTGKENTFDPWPSYCEALEKKVNIDEIRQAISSGKLTLFADVMHGAAASGLGRLLGEKVKEINSNRDPLFAEGAPEPLPKYLSQLFTEIKNHGVRNNNNNNNSGLTLGLVFDGDCDRIAAVDKNANFLSSQFLS
jgi:phosphomannomutase